MRDAFIQAQMSCPSNASVSEYWINSKGKFLNMGNKELNNYVVFLFISLIDQTSPKI